MTQSAPRAALFAGIIQDQDGHPVDVTMVGDEPNYVVEDAGFRRHVEARAVDARVIEMLSDLFMAHRESATEAMLQMLGKDDLFTKAMVDASIRNMDQVLDAGLPDEARAWLGMLGFRVIIDTHGEVVRVDMPEQEIDEE